MPYTLDVPNGTPYRPSNGTEGNIFEGSYCDKCTKDLVTLCPIANAVVMLEKDHPDYPTEWCWQDKWPTCTAYEPIEQEEK